MQIALSFRVWTMIGHFLSLLVPNRTLWDFKVLARKKGQNKDESEACERGEGENTVDWDMGHLLNWPSDDRQSVHGVCETQMGIKWNEAWLSHAFYSQWESLVYEFMHQLEILLRPMALANPISRSGDFVIAAGKAVDTAKITLYFVLDLATSHLNLTAIYQLMVWAWT